MIRGLALLALLAACDGGKVEYTCDGTAARAFYDRSKDNVKVFSPDGALLAELPHVVSASGTRYMLDEATEFWSKGDRARLTIGPDTYDCIVKK